jgi:hypothetical protein
MLVLEPDTDGVAIRGVAVGSLDAQHRVGVRFAFRCDHAWRFRRLDLESIVDSRALVLLSDGEGNWTDGEGHPLAHLAGCMEIDLQGSPITNTLPIRRLALRQGEEAPITVVYVPFDTFMPHRMDQRYTCVEPGRRYLYADADFSAELPVDEDGLVLDYPELFERLRD